MELNFAPLVIAAFVGLIIGAFWGFNPLAIIGAMFLLMLFSPVLVLAFEHSSAGNQPISGSLVEDIMHILPSLVVGELAGVAASSIFKIIKAVF